jgi:hypothetical protein
LFVESDVSNYSAALIAKVSTALIFCRSSQSADFVIAKEMVINGGTFELQMGNTSDERLGSDLANFLPSEMALKLI